MNVSLAQPERVPAAPGPGDPGAIALEADHLTKRFKAGTRIVEALQEVSFRVRHGRVTGLIGPDGAGKSTVMRLAAGLLVPDAGRVTVLGVDATQNSLQVQTEIGYMPQRFGLYEDLSVQENLELYADLQGVPRDARASRYRELMRMTGLAPFTRRLAGRLSGGMKQKLGLACTLLRAPRLLLLDEPTVGVDPVSRRELWEIVFRLVESEGASVLLSTAYLDEAERCAEVVLLEGGRVLEHGSPAALGGRMRGRSYVVTAQNLDRRELQARLATHPGVVDALLLGDRVRVVTESDAGLALADLPGARIEPVPPRLEDSFVALLRERRGGESIKTPKNGAGPGKSAARGEAVIEVRDVARRFGDFYAVRELTFDVGRGEVFGLLGANGAGKTTTFRMLCGLLPATAGTLHVAGLSLRDAAAAAREKIGYMSQRFSLYGNLSVNQNLAFFARTYGLSGARRADRIDWALREFELDEAADTMSQDLPLGYQQRLAMACALMHEPEILFLDEPTSGVDPLARREFWRRINALSARGVTVLVTTHFMEEAEYCDRLAIMAAGRILALGDPASIRRQARSEAQPEPTLEDAFIWLLERAEERGERS